MTEPYKVVVDANNTGCSHCGRGAYWTIEQPDGVLIGTSWEDKEHADDVCELMNLAFAAGAETRAVSVR